MRQHTSLLDSGASLIVMPETQARQMGPQPQNARYKKIEFANGNTAIAREDNNVSIPGFNRAPPLPSHSMADSHLVTSITGAKVLTQHGYSILLTSEGTTLRHDASNHEEHYPLGEDGMFYIALTAQHLEQHNKAHAPHKAFGVTSDTSCSISDISDDSQSTTTHNVMPFESDDEMTAETVNQIVHSEHKAEAAQFYVATMAVPPITLMRALEKDYFSIPGFQANDIRRNKPQDPRTAQAHARQMRKGLAKSHNPANPPEPAIPIEYTYDDLIAAAKLAHPEFDTKMHIIVKTSATRSILSADDTGEYPIESRRGKRYIKVAVFNGKTFLVAMKSLDGKEHAKAYEQILAECRENGHTPHVLNTDNVTSPEVRQVLKQHHVKHTTVPSNGMHFRNLAEKAIQTAKYHLLNTLAVAHSTFDKQDWDLALPMAELTLNMVTPCPTNPKISAYEAFYGQRYDWASHPMAPFGTRVQTLRYPQNRGPFEQHTDSKLYVGPEPATYRGHRCIRQPSRNHPRPWTVHHSITWYPELCRLPHSSPSEILEDAIKGLEQACKDVASAIQDPSKRDIVATQAATAIAALGDFRNMLTFQITLDTQGHAQTHGALPPARKTRQQKKAKPTSDSEDADTEQDAEHEPRKQREATRTVTKPRNPGKQKRVTAQKAVHNPPAATTAEPETSGREPTPPSANTEDVVLPGAPLPQGLQIRRTPKAKVSFEERNSDGEADDKARRNAQTATTEPLMQHIQTRSRIRTIQADILARIREQQTVEITVPVHKAYGVDGQSSGISVTKPKPYKEQDFKPTETLTEGTHHQPISLREARSSRDRELYRAADEDEAERLLGGGKERSTMGPIHLKDIPKEDSGTTMGIAATYKRKDSEGKTIIRARWAANSAPFEYVHETTSTVADHASVHILLNAAVSENAQLKGIDIKDMYLMSLLDHYVYLKINVDMFSDKILDKYNLREYITADKKWIYFQVWRSMYGLPQAGRIAQKKLIKVLEEGGYVETRTQCIFRHRTRNTIFSLIVDDFLVKFQKDEDFKHLTDTLEKYYRITIDDRGKNYLGYTIQHDRVARTITLSMPGRVDQVIRKHRPQWFNGTEKVKGAASPGIYEAFNNNLEDDFQRIDEEEDASVTLSTQEMKELQSIIGDCQYLAIVIFASISTAVLHLSHEKAHPTVKTAKKVERLLQYMAAFPEPTRTYHASDMVLVIQSDASHDSLQGSKDVCGGVYYLGWKKNPYLVNHPFAYMCKIIRFITNSAGESEYAGLFMNGQCGYNYRETLADFGYPQDEPTVILCDNTSAIGIATGKQKSKKSKFYNRRWNWIKEGVKRGLFDIHKIDGNVNLADFFTKILPVSRHRAMVPFFETHKPQTENRFQTKRYLRTAAWLKERAMFDKAYAK